MTVEENLPIAIIGAGPVGLAAASYIIKRGKTPIILEAGDEAGYAIRQWEHVRLFSPWKYNMDKAAVELLKASSWIEPEPEKLPTGKEFLEDYITPLSKNTVLKDFIKYGSKVTAVTRLNTDKIRTFGREKLPYVLKIDRGSDTEFIQASAVIDTSGTWFTPNPIGSGGIKAAGEEEHSNKITYGIPNVLNKDRAKFEDKTIAVVGSGHSAMQVIIDLLELQETSQTTNMKWVMRKTDLGNVFGGGKDDALPARGEIGMKAKKAVEYNRLELVTPFLINKVSMESSGDSKLKVHGFKNGQNHHIEVDEIIATTGFRPDLEMLREVRVNIDSSLESVADIASMIDPNIHSCGTVPPHGVEELKHDDENFFIAGMKSYGRAPTFLMATGYEQVRSIVAYLDGDLEAANRIELDLPETGVCSSNLSLNGAECCAPANSQEDVSSSCCTPNRKTTLVQASPACCG
ncbi:NAD(P)-binding domain-containing protein [Gracilimonas sp.]|uniref:NAD(P)-binding domain-containing protein n=1 Tax=Gracilimonas sp. TaxID=1974203 RepID=UPI0032EDAF20